MGRGDTRLGGECAKGGWRVAKLTGKGGDGFVVVGWMVLGDRCKDWRPAATPTYPQTHPPPPLDATRCPDPGPTPTPNWNPSNYPPRTYLPFPPGAAQPHACHVAAATRHLSHFGRLLPPYPCPSPAPHPTPSHPGPLPPSQVLYSPMPVIWLLPRDVSAISDGPRPRYPCPLYKTPERRGVLSTTGHSTNFVTDVRLPCGGEHTPPSHWTRRGAALLTSLAE